MSPDYEQLWQALPNPAVLLDAEARVDALNSAAEDFLGQSARSLRGRALAGIAGEASRIADLIARVRRGGGALSEYNVDFGWPDAPLRRVDLFAVALSDGSMMITIHPRANAERMGRQLTSRSAARSVVGMAAMLAHEIKNPLAGISGAAQLLEMNASADDQELTDLIREEVDRIGKLVNRVEAFGDAGLLHRAPVNIHDVLDRAARSAKAGFAAHVRFIEDYDPSLPPVPGDGDQLMQIFINLLKNAAEATPPVGGVIMLKTAYRAGVKVRTSPGETASLPLQVEISDNGCGVPDELMAHLFEPFVTSKASGSGLGLALVSKVIADHGGVISCESAPGSTSFRLLLPITQGEDLDLLAEAEAP